MGYRQEAFMGLLEEAKEQKRLHPEREPEVRAMVAKYERRCRGGRDVAPYIEGLEDPGLMTWTIVQN